MKKLFTIIFICFLTMCTAMTFVSCGDDDTETNTEKVTFYFKLTKWSGYTTARDSVYNSIDSLAKVKVPGCTTFINPIMNDVEVMTDASKTSTVKSVLKNITDDEFSKIFASHPYTIQYASLLISCGSDMADKSTVTEYNYNIVK